jgi:outer membrane protein OmpA-like peptidoglycan-associated protein
VDPGQVDPGAGTLETASLMLRLRPFAAAEDMRREAGFFVEAGGGPGVTGELLRATFEGGVGYGIALSDFSVAPVLRYVQVVQPSDPLSDEDARLLMLGAELSFLGKRASDEPAAVTGPPPPPPDLDGDGVPDASDACPDTPEDRDGFEDDDGCPDQDNDGDELLDHEDECPDAAEDVDEWQDDDGCPEDDNDADGFPDETDQCPNEAEVVNGNRDYDGCPDEGLIEMRDDRIVLEERVLFDFERARVKSRAMPILRAIFTLYEQHPEWTQIRIEGHADTRGVEEYNQELSERRARNVRRELVRMGIPGGVIEAIGYGATKPRDLREDDEEAHTRNRRVEFVVVARTVEKVGDGAGDDAAGEGEVEVQPAATPAAGSPPAAPAQTQRAPGAAPAAPAAPGKGGAK